MVGTSGKEPTCQCRRHKRWRSILSREDPLEEGVATQSSILAWRMQWTEQPGGLESIGSHRVGHDWSHLARTHEINKILHSDFKGCYISESVNVKRSSWSFWLKKIYIYICKYIHVNICVCVCVCVYIYTHKMVCLSWFILYKIIHV